MGTSGHITEAAREPRRAKQCPMSRASPADEVGPHGISLFSEVVSYVAMCQTWSNYCGWLRNPAPLRWFIPWFIGLKPSFWWCRFRNHASCCGFQGTDRRGCCKGLGLVPDRKGVPAFVIHPFLVNFHCTILIEHVWIYTSIYIYVICRLYTNIQYIMLYLCHRKISKASNLCQQHGPAERGHHQLPGCFASLKARWQDGRHNLRVLAFFVLSLAVSNLIKQMCIDVYLTLQHYSYRFKHSWLSAHLAYPQLPTLWGPMAVAYVLPT
jgi:hypothetical protein